MVKLMKIASRVTIQHITIVPVTFLTFYDIILSNGEGKWDVFRVSICKVIWVIRLLWIQPFKLSTSTNSQSVCYQAYFRDEFPHNTMRIVCFMLPHIHNWWSYERRNRTSVLPSWWGISCCIQYISIGIGNGRL